MIVMAVLASGSGAVPAQAGPYSDSLSKCLVSNTNEAEKTSLIRWMFIAMSSHPAVADLSRSTPEQRTAANKQFARLTQDLLLRRCRSDAVAALQYEGTGTIEQSFNTLGQIAMRGLMGDKSVTAQIAQIGDFMDKKALAELGSETKKDAATQK